MALIFADSFEHYLTADFSQKWSSTSGSPSISATAARNGSNGFLMNAATEYLQLDLDTTQTTLIAGFAVRFPTSTTGIYHSIRFGVGASTLVCGFSIRHRQMYIQDFNLDDAIIAAASTENVVMDNSTWQYIEFKVVKSGFNGTASVKLNGNLVIPETTIGLGVSAGTDFSFIRFGNQAGSNVTAHYDDFYLANADGTSNNDFLGEVLIENLTPNADGTTTDFAPSAGTNVDNIDDATPDDDGTFNSSSTANDIDTFTHAGISTTNVLDIKAIQVNNHARKTDAAARDIAGVVRSGSTNYSGSSEAVTTSYLFYNDVRDVDPDTSSAWTKTGVDNAEFGYEVGL